VAALTTFQALNHVQVELLAGGRPGHERKWLATRRAANQADRDDPATLVPFSNAARSSMLPDVSLCPFYAAC
jgi:hypothetical protein